MLFIFLCIYYAIYFYFFQEKLNRNLLFNVSTAYRLSFRIHLNKLEFNDKYERFMHDSIYTRM